MTEAGLQFEQIFGYSRNRVVAVTCLALFFEETGFNVNEDRIGIDVVSERHASIRVHRATGEEL